LAVLALVIQVCAPVYLEISCAWDLGAVEWRLETGFAQERKRNHYHRPFTSLLQVSEDSEMVFSPKRFVTPKILSLEYQIYACGNFFLRASVLNENHHFGVFAYLREAFTNR